MIIKELKKEEKTYINLPNARAVMLWSPACKSAAKAGHAAASILSISIKPEVLYKDWSDRKSVV